MTRRLDDIEAAAYAAEMVGTAHCVACGQYITEFKDLLSMREFCISGMCQKCQDKVFDSPEDDEEDDESDEHSVNCYFCGDLFDERDAVPADKWNNNDGGEACPECAKRLNKDA